MITTRPFKTTHAEYLKMILLFWGLRYGWMLILPILAAIIAGIRIDLRWFIVGLAGIFIVCPMILSMIYIYYMLTPEAARSLKLKTITITAEGEVDITYLKVEKSDEDVDERYVETTCELIPATDVNRIYKVGRYTAISLRASHLTLLLIPNNQIIQYA
ncbi:MAG: hypothetical protein NC098_04125 [Lachnoclostridium sp.]|nr:hypothetical protein [Lachnoclostridium sp.]